MKYLRFNSLVLAGCASLAAVAAANAGGFDRGGVNIDLLFDPSDYAAEAGVTYVSPQRTIEDVVRAPQPLPSGGELPAIVTDSIDVDGDYWVPRFSVKANVIDPVDCVGTYSEPFGADQYHGLNNAFSQTAVKFEVDTKDFGLTCSYKMQLGRGMARIIGGVSYQEIDAFLSRQTLLQFGNPGVGTFDLSDNAWSWRIGAAYEIPEIAFRASVVYSARYDVHLKGQVDSTGFGPTVGVGPNNPFSQVPAYTGVFPVTADTEIPQSIELKFQTGIAPGWLAFGSVKWQDWSQLQVIPIEGVYSPIYGPGGVPRLTNVSFDALYRDGWTVTGGVGHKFTDHLSGAVSLTWDRGTKTIIGTQTDTWSFAAGGSWTPNDNVELRLGGVIGVLTGGTSLPSNADPANNVTYTFDDDLLLAGTASLRVKF